MTRRIPGFADKALTTELGRKLEKLVATRALGEQPGLELTRWLESLRPRMRQKLTDIGLLDSRTVASGKPLARHLADFFASLLANDDTAKRAMEVVGKARRICEGCRFAFYSDISASKVQGYLAALRDGGEGISVQTSNHYLQAIKQFCLWMVKDRRASESPVAHLSRMNVKVDRRHDRRSLTAEELSRLLVTTSNGRKHHCLTGRARAMLYRVAMETGFRRNELSTLATSRFDFDGPHAAAAVEARDAKNRKPTVQVIRPELVAEPKTWFQEAGFGPDELLWPRLTDKTAEMLRRDLDEAGIDYVDDAGLFADFHALRHSYISLITSGGVHPKIAQRLARHSDVNLAMTRYSHTLLVDEAEGLEMLPQFASVV
ncbi:MAG TPA: site-specific integrase [Thermoguttaceae bacterium]|nr:site-specific integrase [Thermoguttaceae bacterium]